MANLKTWKERKNVADKKFDRVGKSIEKWRNYYRGKHWASQWGGEDSGTDAYRDKVVDNMVFANIRSIMPSINFNNPKVFVDARRPPFREGNTLFDTNAASSMGEALINYRIQELQLKREVDKCLLDALLGPWGVMQLGYTANIEKIKGVNKLEVNELIQGDSPFAMRVSPLDFRVDAEALDSHLNDAGWVGKKWVKTLDEVKNNPKYENTKNLKPNATVKTDFSGSGVVSPSDEKLMHGSDFARVEGWDFWSLRDGREITIVDTHDKFLRNEKEWSLDYDGYPFKTLYFNENPDELYPISDVDIYLSAQDELNRYRSLQLSHARRISQRKYIARANAFDDGELDKIEYGPDGSIAETTGDPNTAIVPLRDAGTSQDIYIAINQLKASINETSGVAQFEKGIAQKFDTATEPALIAQSTSIKRAERLQTLENFYLDVSKTLLKIDQQTLSDTSIPLNQRQFDAAQVRTPSKLEKITGAEGAVVLQPWLNVSKEDIRGDYDFTMDLGSTEPINQEKRKQDIVTLSQILAGNPFIKSDEATRRILDAFDIKDQDSLLKTGEEVAKEQQAAAQAQAEAALAQDMPKRQVDMAKTQLKSDTTIQTTLMKILSEREKDTSLKDIAEINRSTRGND